MLISKKASMISKSQTLAISALAKEMKAQGISVISFTAGEPDCNTPTYIIDEAKAALDAGKTKYTPSSGTVSLRTAIKNKLKKENGLDYDMKQIIVSNGGKHALFNALYSIIDEGDEVIIPTPYWLTYPELVNLVGGKCVFVEGREENDFKITSEDLKKAITKKTKAFILNSPSNPTGAVYSKEELYSLAKVLEGTDVITISDEIYEKLTYGVEQFSIATYSEKMKNKTIVVNGFSKTYAMTGWRVGYLAAPLEIADAIDGVQSHMTSNVNSIAQEAAAIAFSRDEDVAIMRDNYQKRKDYIVSAINEIEGLKAFNPHGAFYLFVKISDLFGKKYEGESILTSVEFCTALMKEGVATIPCSPFGAEGYMRLSFALSMDDIEEGVKRIASFTKKLS